MLSTEAVYNDPELTRRLAGALKGSVEMPAKMTSEDFSEYGRAGVKAVLLHIGAVDAEKLAESKRSGVPLPAPHSPQWAPVRETTLKAAVQAEITALVELLNQQGIAGLKPHAD